MWEFTEKEIKEIVLPVLILVCVEVSVGENKDYDNKRIHNVLILVCVEVSVGGISTKDESKWKVLS